MFHVLTLSFVIKNLPNLQNFDNIARKISANIGLKCCNDKILHFAGNTLLQGKIRCAAQHLGF